jgi:aminopeptidase N
VTIFMKSVVLALLLVLAASSAAFGQRLPGGAIPEHYHLWFAPDFQTDSFRGRATIDVQLAKPARAIILHAAEIAFQEVLIEAAGWAQLATVALDDKRETATLTVTRQLPRGPAKIVINYTGILNDKLRGFYLSKANDRKYAVSQMEATDARRAFPSFDEPVYKATFDIEMMIDDGDIAISNGPLKSDTPGPELGKHTVTFGRTKRMSTYLVALIVGDFVCREGTSDGIPLRVCSTPDKKHLTGFALEAAVQQLAFYNDYYGIKYPFEKLDIIGIPDFAAGAMENTGAITFREQFLLADPERASLTTKKTVAGILSHEIAHQWFGNLVTMKWWDDIWLNEGFATWMANKPLAVWKPEWSVDLDSAQETQHALALDTLRTTRAIRTNVETPEEINEVFDGIAYGKAGAVLRMVERYVGADAFRAGVASYIKRYSYANAAAEDFWTEVARVTGKPVDRIMRSYVDQPGVPVLEVSSTCAGGTTVMTIEQERFLATPGAANGAASDTTLKGRATTPTQTWTIPVCLKGSSCHVMSKTRDTVRVPGCGAEAFINSGSLGYFFTEYTPETVRELSQNALGGLGPAERVGLLGDEWRMAQAGRHDIGVVLDLIAALADDPTPGVTASVQTPVAYTAEYLVSERERLAFESWVQSRFGPVLDRLGAAGNSSDELEQSRRAALLELVGIWGGARQVQKQAREQALGYITDPSSLPATLVPAVVKVAASSGDAALYERYVARIKELAADPEEYYRFFNALPYFRDPAVVKRTLESALSSDVRTQDSATLIVGLLALPWSRPIAWAFVKAEWARITDRLGTFQGVPYMMFGLANFCSVEEAGEVKSFFATHPVPQAERGLRQAIEQMERCAAMRTRQSGPFGSWLSRQ